MISRISLNKYASYLNSCEFIPTKVNYIYGANGSGKTSIGKLIASNSKLGECKIEYSNSPIRRLVYNKDFVNDNFKQSADIKGIFTLGHEAKEIQDAIQEAKDEIALKDKLISGLEVNLERNRINYSEAEDVAIDNCWAIKQRFDKVFKPAFSGHIGSKRAFFTKCTSISVDPASEILNESELIEKCMKVFQTEVKVIPMLPLINLAPFFAIEDEKILKRRIVGNNDIPFGKLIVNLNNSDWVKKGLDYIEDDSVCPFCQQDLNEKILDELRSFFNRDYIESVNRIKEIETEYEENLLVLSEQIDTITSIISGFSNVEEIKGKLLLLLEYLGTNVNLIKTKFQNPSLSISLTSIAELSTEIREHLQRVSEEIEANNQIFSNLAAIKTELINQIWIFVIQTLDGTLGIYDRKLKLFDTTNQSLTKRLYDTNEIKRIKEEEIKSKEALITSIIHSVNEINKILTLFGFTNFKIAESSKPGFYKVVREDGSDVNETLSEGEYNLLTFLYFYHLVKGNTEQTGIFEDKIIVIDDPISSLDSSSLYVVSNLVKNLIEDCLKRNHNFKQLFVFTHNVYFYKEITFKGMRETATKEESFWIIKKINNCSQIQHHTENPITTSYDLLWKELRDVNSVNKVTIFNTLRRILEYYFNILGGINYEGAIHEFEGEEKKICKSLISWINDGSHYIYEDDILYIDEGTIQKYIKVFELIFIRLGHESHFRMMMKLPTKIVTPIEEEAEESGILEDITEDLKDRQN